MESVGLRPLVEGIKETLGDLTPAERKAARFLMAHYPVAGLDTLTGLAARAGVSGASILRMVTKLGYSGYPEFQRHLRQELAAHLESPLIRGRDQAAGETTATDFLDRFAERSIDNIRRSFSALPRSEFESVVGYLCDSNRTVYLIGGRISGRIASYMAQHLRAIRPRVLEIEGANAVWPDQLLGIERGDIVLLFDVRRYQPDLEDFAAQAARRGAKLVLFTDEWLSPVSRRAAHVFPARIASVSSWDSAAGTLAFAEALIAAVSDRLGKSFTGRMADLETLREALDRAASES